MIPHGFDGGSSEGDNSVGQIKEPNDIEQDEKEEMRQARDSENPRPTKIQKISSRIPPPIG